MLTYTNPPKECDICHAPITSTFVDGSTYFGPWANMCQSCHAKHGNGLGTGKGQLYKRQSDGQYHKIKG